MVSFSQSFNLNMGRSGTMASLCLLMLTGVLGLEAQAQTPIPPVGPLAQTSEPTTTQSTGTNPGIAEGQALMQQAEAAIASQDYGSAITQLQAARESLNELSGNYRQLSSLFTGIDQAITDNFRQRALEAAQLRDQATLQQALVYRAQNKPELAVPLLMEIVASQGPTRELGQRSYQELYALGFVDVAFPRNDSGRAQSGAAVRPLNQPNSTLGITAAQNSISQAEQAIANRNYTSAAEQLQTARTDLNRISGYYQQLVGIFTGVDNRVSDSVRQQALQAAQLRDRATFLQGTAYRGQNRPDLAIPLFMEILSSQNPTRELGGQAYQQLFEMGYVELPYAPPTPAAQGSN
jgi:hypothetical protein